MIRVIFSQIKEGILSFFNVELKNEDIKVFVFETWSGSIYTFGYLANGCTYSYIHSTVNMSIKNLCTYYNISHDMVNLRDRYRPCSTPEKIISFKDIKKEAPELLF